MTSTPDITWLFAKAIIGLLVVVGLAFVMLRYGLPKSRFFQKNQARWLKIVSRVPLDPRNSLCVVKILDRYFVLSLGDHGGQKITELSKEEGEAIESP